MIVVLLKILQFLRLKGNVPVSLKSIPQSITSNYPFVLKNCFVFFVPQSNLFKGRTKQCALHWHRFEITISHFTYSQPFIVLHIPTYKWMLSHFLIYRMHMFSSFPLEFLLKFRISHLIRRLGVFGDVIVVPAWKENHKKMRRHQ